MKRLLIAALALAASATHAAVQPVANDAQLVAAVKAAKGGDSIALAPGSYGFFIDQAPHDFGANPLTITSADPAHPATVAGINIAHWKGVTLSNLVVTFGGLQNGILYAVDSDRVTLDHLDLNGGGAKGNGLVIGGQCSTCTLQNSLVHDIGGGVVMNSAGPNAGPVTIANTEFYRTSQDAIHGAFGNKVTISHVTAHDFVDPGDGSHADAVQFENLPYGTHYPMDDIKVVDNWFYQGASTYGMQGVFLHGGQDAVQVLNRAIIERNVVCVPDQFNGVYASGAIDFSVRDNYVAGPKSMKVFVHQGVRGVVSGNLTNNLDLGQNTDVTVEAQSIVLAVPKDCAIATAYAAATGAGAGPRATLGPQAVVKAVSTAPAPSLAPQVADLTAKLAAANGQVAALTQQLADAQARTTQALGQAELLQANLAASRADQEALTAKIAAYVAARAALGF